MMEMNMAMVEEGKYEKSEGPEEIGKTHTDRNNTMGNFDTEFIQHEKVEPKKKLATTRRQVCELDKARNTVKRPRSVSDAHENPHNLTTSPIVQMEMDVATVEEKKYEVLGEAKEIAGDGKLHPQELFPR
jgi:hypothetical protein